jgi:hypothetical protein
MLNITTAMINLFKRIGLINTYDNCIGLTLFSFSKYKIELWKIPPYYRIKEHIHPNIYGEIIYLKGSVFFYRRDIHTNQVVVRFCNTRDDCFRWFTISPNHSHYFKTFTQSVWFINVEKWKSGSEVTSSAIDFVITERI